MGAVNVLLFMLVLIIFIVCEATDSDPFSLTCENVTGSVGEKLTLTCHVWHRSDCCIRLYKFKYAEDDSDSEICRNESTTCEQMTKLTCPYTSNERRTAKVMFFLQFTCGYEIKTFTVKITGPIRPKFHKREITKEEGHESSQIIIAAVSIFIIIIIIIIMVVIRKRKRSRLQMDYKDLSESQK